jgi:hypothetical protein
MCNGINEMLRWDGFTNQMETAGVAPPATAPSVSGAGSGSLSGTYTAYVRFVDRTGNFSNISPVSAEVTVSGVASIVYSGVAVSTDPKVTKRQILRNTSGQAQTYYVDIETTDISSSTFSSTRADSDLSAQTVVALIDDGGNSLIDLYRTPPTHKAVLAHHLDRMFLAVEVEYTQGSVALSLGSNTVTGIATEWPATFVGRFLWALAADKSYEIASVDTAKQVITLTEDYAGDTDPFGSYSIRPAPAERRLVYYSEAGLPESWPAVNALSIQEDGDEITGLMQKGSFLYILERKHIYRFTFQSDPAKDGFVFLSANRGCINNRCWVMVDDTAYMLDEGGVHAFGGSEDNSPLSVLIQDIFESERNQSSKPFRINYAAREFFHAVHYPGQETIRWFVALAGCYLPRHALCYNYRQKRWWIEEFSSPMGASCLGRRRGKPQVYLGGLARKVYAYGVGSLDGPDPTRGTVRGLATSATQRSLTDSLASFAASGLVGSPVSICEGRGKGQTRRIAAVDAPGGTLQLTSPWMVLPDTTSVYQVGGVPWRFQTGWFRWAPDEEENPRRVELVYMPTASPAAADLRVYSDRGTAPDVWQTRYTSDEAAGVASDVGDTDLVVDLSKSSGFAQKRMDSRRDLYLDGPRYMLVELAGVGGRDQVRLIQISVDGVLGAGG